MDKEFMGGPLSLTDRAAEIVFGVLQMPFSQLFWGARLRAKPPGC
jgi:hypothetical protein